MPLVVLGALGALAIAAAATFVATRPSDQAVAAPPPGRTLPATSTAPGGESPSSQADQPTTGTAEPAGVATPAPTQSTSGLVGTDAPASRSVTMLARATAPQTSPNSIDSAGNAVSYNASQMLDGLAETCWRADGEGKGIVVDFDLGKPTTITDVGLINGYAKVDPTSGADRYAEERRILRVTWLVGGRAYPQVLRDGVRTVQPMSIDPTTTDQVRLVIDATTPPGNPDFDTTAISEVELFGT